MPAVERKYDPNDRTWAKQTDEAIDKERRERAAAIAKRREWYLGRHPDPLVVEPGKLNDNIKYNLAGRAVNKALEFMGEPEKLDLTPDDDETDDSPQQRAVDDLYELEFMDQFSDLALEGALTGHNFVKLYVDDQGLFRASVLDPSIMTVCWERGRGFRVKPLWYRAQWREGDWHYRQDVVPVSLIDATEDEYGRTVIDYNRGWRILDYRMRENQTQWEPLNADDWGWPFAPIVDAPTLTVPWEYYGQPLLSDSMIDLNHAVNFIASNTARIIKFHAHPRTVGIGFEPPDVKPTAVDGLFTVPEGGNVFNLEMNSDLSSSMGMLGEVKTQFFAEMRVVDQATVKDRIGNLTNFGLRMLYNDQIQLTENMRETFGELVSEVIYRMGLVLNMGFEKPAAVWPDMLPVNRIELLQEQQIESQLGTSKQTLAEDRGRNWEIEEERKTDEQQSEAEALTNVLVRAGERGGGFGAMPAQNGARE